MNGIKIEKIQPLANGDSRGETFELFKGFPGLQVTYYKRKQGMKFACHFHTGEDPSKNPELFFLLQGKVKIVAENGKTQEKEEIIVEERNMITIEKGVYHEFEALSDVSFLEYRSTLFDERKSDCFPKEEYLDYLQTFTV